MPARKETAISSKVFVGNLNFSTTKEDLIAVLSEAGKVIDIRLPSDRETGRPRGFAFVEFSSEGEAADAIRKFNDRELGGRRLKVNAAEERPVRPPGGGSSPRPFRPTGSAPPPSFNDFGSSNEGMGEDFRPGPFKNKGSRRGLRGRKRSLNY